METSITSVNEKFGLSVALATPFNTDLSLNTGRLIEHAQWCLANGCNSITVLGSTGEGPSVSSRERAEILTALQGVGITEKHLIVGIFATDAAAAVAMAREARSASASKILIAPPFYFKGVEDEGVLKWFFSVFDQLGTDLPEAIIYNLPAQTGVTITPELISRLRDRYGSSISGVKDSSSSLDSTRGFLDKHGDIAVLVGDERHLGTAMADGAEGSICGMANLQPYLMKQIIERSCTDADIESLVNEICRYPLFAAIKYVMSVQHDDLDWANIRPPFVPLAAADKTALGNWYKDQFH